MDYCYDPTFNATHSDAPTQEPTMEPVGIMTTEGDLEWEATSTETFDGVNMEIGWIQYSHCEEGDNANEYNEDYSMDDLIEMAETAITVKIMPSGETPGQNETASYTVMADLCSNPIYALNRGYTMSWQLDETTDPPVITGYADTGGDHEGDLLVGRDAVAQSGVL